jgi:hypothetical protein
VPVSRSANLGPLWVARIAHETPGVTRETASPPSVSELRAAGAPSVTDHRLSVRGAALEAAVRYGAGQSDLPVDGLLTAAEAFEALLTR